MGGGGRASKQVGQCHQYAKTSVWWDMDTCHVPRDFDCFGGGGDVIAENIRSALADLDHCGPVSISAYVACQHTPFPIQQSLTDAGITFIMPETFYTNIPQYPTVQDLLISQGTKDANDKKLIVDMLLWAIDNPPPANCLLISGDRVFSNALHQLSMRGYNILLAQPQRAFAPLLSSAKSVWLWTSLLVGGPPLRSADSSLPPNAANDEMSVHSLSNPLHVNLPVESVPKSFQWGNLKASGNSSLDKKFRGKQPWRSSSQSNIPRTSSNEFWLPHGETRGCSSNGSCDTSNQTQGGSSNGSYDTSNQKWMSAIPQQSEVPTSKSSSTSFFHPTPLNVPREGIFPLQTTSSFPEQLYYAPERQFNEAPHDFFAPTSLSARRITTKDWNYYLNNYWFQNSDLLLGSDGPPTRMPDTMKLNISDCPNSLHSNPSFQENIEVRPNAVLESTNLGKNFPSHEGLHAHHHPFFCPDTSNSRYPHHGLEFPPPVSLPMDNDASDRRLWDRHSLLMMSYSL